MDIGNAIKISHTYTFFVCTKYTAINAAAPISDPAADISLFPTRSASRTVKADSTSVTAVPISEASESPLTSPK